MTNLKKQTGVGIHEKKEIPVFLNQNDHQVQEILSQIEDSQHLENQSEKGSFMGIHHLNHERTFEERKRHQFHSFLEEVITPLAGVTDPYICGPLELKPPLKTETEDRALDKNMLDINAELLDKPSEVQLPVDLRKKNTGHREGYFSDPKASAMGNDLDLFARKKNGKLFPVEISHGHYEFGGERLAVAFISDITARKQAQQELKQLNEELERRVVERTSELKASLDREKELNEMKSRFVSMASHEFRTPLSAVLSSVSLIEQYSRVEQEDKRKKHIERIKSSVKNLTEILNDFLSLDKLEQGKVDVDFQQFNLEEFGTDAIDEVNNLRKKGQHINYKYTGEQEISQDKRILRNVLLNLLSNACKYSEEDKSIDLTINHSPEAIVIIVTDYGIGIPEEEQENLFRKFYRARNAVNIQGTGLGLNIVKHYLELINGAISFTSVKNTGTTFTVTLPGYQNA